MAGASARAMSESFHDRDTMIAKLSIIPDSVEPSFAILTKISPGAPSSNMLTVM